MKVRREMADRQGGRIMISGGESKAWEVETVHRPYGLQVVRLKRTFVLPWTQFLYAEGNSEEVKAVFTTHDVLVKGSDLGSLLSDLAAQRITILREPSRSDRFVPVNGPRIMELEVSSIRSE